MKLLPDETTLVVAGAWNPAILTPKWVLDNAYSPEEGAQAIQALMPIGMFYAYPKYVLGKIHYTASNDTLIIHPIETNDDLCKLVEGAAEKIVILLSHTPVTGVGHNFEFVDEQPSPEQLKLFNDYQSSVTNAYPEGFQNSATQLITVITNEDKTVIISITKYYDGNKLGIKFNFHHPINDAKMALSVLSEREKYKSFSNNYEVAKNIVKGIYGETCFDDNQ